MTRACTLKPFMDMYHLWYSYLDALIHIENRSTTLNLGRTQRSKSALWMTFKINVEIKNALLVKTLDHF